MPISEYALATKFYNEREQLPKLIENIAVQTHRPKVCVFVDDGSIDGSGEIAVSNAEKQGLEYRLVSMPKKERGNLDTLGRAWNKAQPILKQLSDEVSFFATTDVDTVFPSDYFEQMIAYMERNPKFGIIAGQIAGAPKHTFPMFTGKTIRAEVIKYIEKYWDISIDSFLNIKALALGYEIAILDDMEVESPPSHLQTKSGRYRAGRIAYYAGVNPLYAIGKGLFQRDAMFLRGYWSEYFRGTWRCTDQDILVYYQNELIRKIQDVIQKVMNIS